MTRIALFSYTCARFNQNCMKTLKRVKKSCNQCEALVINGIFCHEHGCPNEHKKWDNESEEWKSLIECPECGCDVEEGETCCNIY